MCCAGRAPVVHYTRRAVPSSVALAAVELVEEGLAGQVTAEVFNEEINEAGVILRKEVGDVGADEDVWHGP